MNSLWGVLSKAQGLFSEFHAVLGALKFAEANAACDVLVRFNSWYYLDPAYGPNWWAYFFEELMPVAGGTPAPKEVHCRGWHRYGPYFFNDSWVTITGPAGERHGCGCGFE